MSCYSMVIYMIDKIMGSVTVSCIIWYRGIFVYWGTFRCLINSLHFIQVPGMRKEMQEHIFMSSSARERDKSCR